MPKLFLVSGPSGSGKTTIMRRAMNNEITSFTTRAPRAGEVDGVDYIYISEGEFQHLFDTGGLAEYTNYYGTANYGLTKSEIEGKLAKGDAFAIVDVVGKRQLEEMYPNTVSIFILSTSAQVEERMRKRGDSEERIEQRLKTFHEEMQNGREYDYTLYNKDGYLEKSVETIKSIVGGTYDKPFE